MPRTSSTRASSSRAPRAPKKDFAAELEQAKRASTAQLLFRCARRLDEHARATLSTPGGLPRPRAAHTALLPHVDLEGTRLTELARRVGVSKQAVGQLVDELEEMGLLERIQDPEDGRAKLVRFSARGRESLLSGLLHLRGIEGELRRSVGARRMDALHDALVALDAHLETLGGAQSRGR